MTGVLNHDSVGPWAALDESQETCTEVHSVSATVAPLFPGCTFHSDIHRILLSDSDRYASSKQFFWCPFKRTHTRVTQLPEDWRDVIDRVISKERLLNPPTINTVVDQEVLSNDVEGEVEAERQSPASTVGIVSTDRRGGKANDKSRNLAQPRAPLLLLLLLARASMASRFLALTLPHLGRDQEASASRRYAVFTASDPNGW